MPPRRRFELRLLEEAKENGSGQGREERDRRPTVTADKEKKEKPKATRFLNHNTLNYRYI